MSSWLVCPCGTRIATGSFPNPGVGRVISEASYDAVEDPVDRKGIARLFLGGDLLARCPSCSRLLLQSEDGVTRSFVEEQPVPPE
jgi:hypothetical protein